MSTTAFQVKQQATTIAPPSTLASGGEGPSAKEGGGGGGDRNSLMRGGSGPGPQGSGGPILGQEPEEESVVNTIRLYARGAGTSMSPALAGRLSLAKGRSVGLGFECLNEEARRGGGVVQRSKGRGKGRVGRGLMWCVAMGCGAVVVQRVERGGAAVGEGGDPKEGRVAEPAQGYAHSPCNLPLIMQNSSS